MKPELLRPAWRDLTLHEKRAHLLADHRFMPARIGGDDDEGSTWALNTEDVARLDLEHETEHAEILYHDLPLTAGGRVTHHHLPRLLKLESPTSPWPTFAITFSNEAWEFMYNVLDDFVTRQLTVHLNGSPNPYQLVQLQRSCDIHQSDGDTPLLIAKRWNEVTDDYDDEVAIPLFVDNTCAIWQITVN